MFLMTGDGRAPGEGESATPSANSTGRTQLIGQRRRGDGRGGAVGLINAHRGQVCGLWSTFVAITLLTRDGKPSSSQFREPVLLARLTTKRVGSFGFLARLLLLVLF